MNEEGIKVSARPILVLICLNFDLKKFFLLKKIKKLKNVKIFEKFFKNFEKNKIFQKNLKKIFIKNSKKIQRKTLIKNSKKKVKEIF